MALGALLEALEALLGFPEGSWSGVEVFRGVFAELFEKQTKHLCILLRAFDALS